MNIISIAAESARSTVLVENVTPHVTMASGELVLTIDSGMAKLIIAAAVTYPGNLRVTSGAPGESIAYAWDAAAGAAKYLIQIHDSDGMRREFETVSLSAIYSATDAINDGGHKRRYTIKIASYDPAVGRSDYAELVVENAAPATPIISITPQTLGFAVIAENALEGDYAGMIVWASDNPSVAMDGAHKVYQGYSQTATIPWPSSDTAYFRVARYDTFGQTDLNVTSEFASTKAAVAGLIQTATLPGTTYLGDNVVFYTVTEEFYQWNASASPAPTYERVVNLQASDFGGAAWLDVGTGSGDVSAGDHGHAQLTAQTQATWEAGTGTTESIVSPAKVAAAIAALATGGGLQVASGANFFTATSTPTDLVVTGLGFTPKLVVFIAIGGGGSTGFSQAYIDSTTASTFWTALPTVGSGGSSGVTLLAEDDVGEYATGDTGATLDADGFTCIGVYSINGPDTIFSYQYFAIG